MCSLHEAFHNIATQSEDEPDCPIGSSGDLHIVNLAPDGLYVLDDVPLSTLEGVIDVSISGNGATIRHAPPAEFAVMIESNLDGATFELSISDLTLDFNGEPDTLIRHTGGILRLDNVTLQNASVGVEAFSFDGVFPADVFIDNSAFHDLGIAVLFDGQDGDNEARPLEIRDTLISGNNLGVLVSPATLVMERVVYEPPYSEAVNLVGGQFGVETIAEIRDTLFNGVTGLGLHIQSNSNALVERSTFAGGSGIGILLTANTSSADIRNSTFSGLNVGLEARANSQATINNATFAFNTVAVDREGNGSPQVFASNSIFANSSSENCNQQQLDTELHNVDDDGTCINDSDDTTIFGQDPLLASLADNGGFTPTHALMSGSPAINAGHPNTGPGTFCEPTDQRGVARPQGEFCDIGAFEALFSAISLSKTITSGEIYEQAGDVIEYEVEASNTGDATLTNVVISDPDLGTLSCTPGQPATLPPGSDTLVCTGSYTVTAEDTMVGSFTNTATVNAFDPDGNPVSGEDSATAFGPSVFIIPDGAVEANDDGRCNLAEAFNNISTQERLFEGEGNCPRGSPVLNTVILAAGGQYPLDDLDGGMFSYLDVIFAPVVIEGNGAEILRPALGDEISVFESFDNFSLESLTLDGGGLESPLIIHGGETLRLLDVTLRNSGAGIEAFEELPISIVILGSEFRDLGTALSVFGSPGLPTNVQIFGTDFIDADLGAFLDNARADVTVSTFEHTGNTFGGTGLILDGTQAHDHEVSNTSFLRLETGIDIRTGNLNLLRSTFALGGAGVLVSNGGFSVDIVNSTFSGQELGLGTLAGTTRLNNVSFAFNETAVFAQFNGSPTVFTSNTLFADDGSDNCVGGGVVSSGFNLDSDGTCVDGATDLIGLDPQLDTLANNGGPTLTHALQPGSPAISAGNPSTDPEFGPLCESTDQRGVARPQDGNNDGNPQCDIGAFELEGSPDPSVELIKSISAGSPYTNPGDVITYEFVATNTGNVTLENVVIDDPEVAVVDCELTQPAVLEPEQSQFCSGSYVITQADVDAGFFTNTATVTGEDPFGTPVSAQDSATAVVDGTLTGTCFWIGGASGSWHVAANWDCSAHDGIPTSGDEVFITPEVNTVVDFGADGEAWGLVLGIDDGSATHSDAHTLRTTADDVELVAGAGGVTVRQTGLYQLGRVGHTFQAPQRATLSSSGPILAHGKLWPSNAMILGNIVLDQPGVGGARGWLQARGWNDVFGTIQVPSGFLQPIVAGVGFFGAAAPHLRVIDGDILIGPGSSSQLFVNDASFSQPAFTVTGGILDNGGNISTEGFPSVTIQSPILIDAQVRNAGAISSRLRVAQGLRLVGPAGTEHVNSGLIEIGALLGDDTEDQAVPGFGLSIGEGRSLRNTSQITIHRLRSADGVVTNAGGGVVSDETEVTGAGTYVLGFAGPQQVSIALNDPGDISLLAMDWTAADHPSAGLDPRMVGGGHWWSLAATTVDEAAGSGSLSLTLPRLVAAQTEPLVCRFEDSPGEWQCLDTQVEAASVTATGLTTLSDWAVGNQITEIPPEPAIALTKSITSGSPYAAAGDVIRYSLVATNTGNVELTQVTISDPRLGALACAPAQPATRQPGESLNCTGSYTVTQANVDAGSVSNTATASGRDPDNNLVTAQATATAQGPAPAPTIRMAKSITSGERYSEPGDVIAYLLEMTNTGNLTLTQAFINDPDLELIDCGGQSMIQAAPAPPPAASRRSRLRAMARSEGTQRVQRNPALQRPEGASPAVTLLPGESFACSGEYAVTEADLAAGSFTNTATAAALTPAGAVVSDQDSATAIGPLLLIPAEADLGVIDVGETFSFTVTAVGGLPPYAFAIGSLPEGFSSVTTATGVILSGTGLRAGRLEFPITVRDSSQPLEQLQRTYLLRVATDLEITPDALPDGVEGVDYFQALGVANGIPPYTFQADALPPGINLQRNVLSGTPTQAGSFEFSVIATDAQDNVGEAVYTLTIGPPDFGATNLELPDGVVNVSYGHQLFANSPANPVVWSDAQGLPPGLELQYTGFIAGTPTQAGSFQITARATNDDGQTIDANAPLVVLERGVINATPALPPGVAGRAYTGPLTLFGSDPPFDCTLASGALPDGLALAECDSGITGIPGVPGSFGFELLVTDSATPPASDRGPFGIRIADPDALADIPGLVGAPTVTVPVPDFGQGRPSPDLPDESLQQMAIDGFGNRYLVGYSFNGNDYDLLVLKFDPDGKPLWSQRFDSGDHDFGYGIAVNPIDQGIYVAGYLLNGNRYEGVLLSFDAAGVLRWEQRITGGVLADALYGVAADRDGVYVTGERYNGNNFDALYAGFSHQGVVRWIQLRTAAPTQTGYVVNADDCALPPCALLVGGSEGAALTDGWLLAVDRATGAVTSEQSFSQTGILASAGTSDGWVIGGDTAAGQWRITRITRDLQPVWSTTFADGERLRGMVADEADFIYAAGRTGTGDDALLTLLAPTGQVIDSRTFNTGAREQFNGVGIGPEGVLTAAGERREPGGRRAILFYLDTGKGL